MNDSVESDALVIPSSSGSAVARSLPNVHPFARLAVLEDDAISTCSPTRKSVSADVVHADLAAVICRTITSMCLSLILHALEAVDLLNLVDHDIWRAPSPP